MGLHVAIQAEDYTVSGLLHALESYFASAG
jgi:hypothetical protein